MTTPLDAACRAMLADPDDDAARLRYYARLADGELFLLLDREPPGEVITPRVFALEEGPVVLAFDQEDRLSAFAGMPAPYAALPGRVIARQLAGQGTGLAVNLGVPGAAWIVTPEAVDWLADTLAQEPAEVVALPIAFHPPRGLPQELLSALDAKLARAGGLAAEAVLAAVDYADGRRGHMLAFLGAVPGAETALARAAGEALTFSGLDAGEIDVAFLSGDSAAGAALLRCGLRFVVQDATGSAGDGNGPAAPGMDPDRPPRLR